MLEVTRICLSQRVYHGLKQGLGDADCPGCSLIGFLITNEVYSLLIQVHTVLQGVPERLGVSQGQVPANSKTFKIAPRRLIADQNGASAGEKHA